MRFDILCSFAVMPNRAAYDADSVHKTMRNTLRNLLLDVKTWKKDETIFDQSGVNVAWVGVHTRGSNCSEDKGHLGSLLSAEHILAIMPTKQISRRRPHKPMTTEIDKTICKTTNRKHLLRRLKPMLKDRKTCKINKHSFLASDTCEAITNNVNCGQNKRKREQTWKLNMLQTQPRRTPFLARHYRKKGGEPKR